MDFFRRIGTQRHKFKLQFFIKRIVFNKALTGKIYISIKRGDHKLTTEHQVEADRETLIANFQNEILTFPAITLFYEEGPAKYQEKPGQIKVIMLTSKGDKKLLGQLDFDLAEYANEHKQSFKFKKKLEETPAKLDAQLQFQVYLKFMGEASQTDKSIPEQKRADSPFDKISSFFTGGNQEQKAKAEQQSSNRGNSAKKKDAQRNRVSTEQQANQASIQKRQKKKKGQSTQEEADDYRSAVEQNKGKVQVKTRPLSDAKKQTQNGSPHKKHQKEKKAVAEQQELFQNYQPVQNEKQKAKKPKKEQRQRVSYQYEEQQKNSEVSTVKSTSKVAKPPIVKRGKDNEQFSKEKQDQDSQQRSVQSDRRKQKKMKSTNPKMKGGLQEETESANKNEQAPQFFFQDPQNFPPGKQKKSNVPLTPPETPKQPRLEGKQSKVAKVKAESDQVTSRESQQGSPKRHSKKVKQNTIQISREAEERLLVEKDKRKSKEYQIFGVTPVPKVLSTKQESVQVQQSQRKEIKLQKVAEKQSGKSRALPEQNVESLEQSQVENMFQRFDVERPIQRVQFKQSPSPKKPVDSKNKIQVESAELLQLRRENEQLKLKIKDEGELINRLREQGKISSKQIKQLQLKLKQTEQSGVQKAAALEKALADSAKDKLSFQKQIQKLKAENNTMKIQIANSNKNQSFFRETDRQYQEKSIDEAPQQQIKRLQKQKNEQLIINQQQKDKHRKEVKKFAQQLQKEKARYKQLEDASKVDLKKLKDHCTKLNLLIENMQSENGDKVKQNSVLIEQNKKANDIVIELRDKLASIKLKICEKLNDANERQESELMQALTDLSEDI